MARPPAMLAHSAAPNSVMALESEAAPEPPKVPSAAQSRAFALHAKNFKYSSGVRLENEFIRTLRQTKDSEEKASMAQMLGRAHSINALPHLLNLLNDKEAVNVRTAAAQAVSAIGASTSPNSYTTTELSNTLLSVYKHRKAILAERLGQPTRLLPYAQKLEEKGTRQELMTELQTLLSGISQLNVNSGRKALQDEYRSTIMMNLMNDGQVKQMIRATEIAEEEFHKELEKKYQKPVSDILKEIPREELEAMKKQVLIRTPQGQTINLIDAKTQIAFLKEQHEQFSNELLTGLIDALSIHEDKATNTVLKMTLTSNNPDLKAKSLQLLSQRNSLNYNSDIYPNLYARDPQVRKAAIQALLNSQEFAARQKTMELLKPHSYLELLGGPSINGIGSYAQFLGRIAENGDEYIEALSNRALHSDYDPETRQIALLVLGMMTQEPINHAVSPQTQLQAQATIRLLALQPPSRTPEDFETLSFAATQLWVGLKDPNAITHAIVMADNKNRRLNGLQQSQLLNSVFAVLQDDRQKSEQERLSERQHQLLDILMEGKNPTLSEKEGKHLREQLLPKAFIRKLNPQKPEGSFEANQNEQANASLIQHLKPVTGQLRPYLSRLAESDKSRVSQILAMRISGLLQDTQSLEAIKDRVRDPLKGKIDWNADLSFEGNPANAAANIRLNALSALGDMGHSDALDVMSDALDDPTLKTFVAEPLSKVAAHANDNASAASLAKVRTKLVRLLETPDTSRYMRAVRIKAADTLFQFKGGPEEVKAFANRTTNPNFKRHVLAALLQNNHGFEVEHPDHDLIKGMIHPGLGVERLHQQGITGKGIQMAIVDGGYVDIANQEGFQNRVKLPAIAEEPEHPHPTMVMSTAAANGKLKGVAPDATVFSDKWPNFQAADTMEVYKKIIEGKLRGENDIRVINNSWGFSNQSAILHKDVRNILKDYKKVVDLAEKAGIQIVFAAGNEGENAGFPKVGTLSVFGMDIDKLTEENEQDVSYILDKVILAGALNTLGSEDKAQHRMADFSSRGDSLNRMLSPTVVAPGADMMVYGWDKYKGNPKMLVNGTSFASPYVSGLLTLMLQKNPTLKPADLREILKKTAVKLPNVPDTEQGHGEIDPEAAVRLAGHYQTGRKRKTSQASHQDNDTPPGASGGGGVPPVQAAGLLEVNGKPLGAEQPWPAVAALDADFLLRVSGPQSLNLDRLSLAEPKLPDWKTGSKPFLQGKPLAVKPGFMARSKPTPSVFNRKDFRRGPQGLPRMNPPKSPFLATIR